MQDIEKLALVLVQALDLDIKNCVGVQDDPRLLGHVVGKAALVRLLYHLQTVQDRPVLPALLQLAQRFRMQQIVVSAAAIANQAVQVGVGLGQPAAVVNAVGDVLELGGTELADIPEHLPAQDVRVEGRHAVDRAARAYAQVCHADLAAPDDRHVGNLADVVAEPGLQLGLIPVSYTHRCV